MNIKYTFFDKYFLAVSCGLIYFWFGILKSFQGLSPVEGLAIVEMNVLTFGYISSYLMLFTLAVLEVGNGLCLILNLFRNQAIKLALINRYLFSHLFFFFQRGHSWVNHFIFLLLANIFLKT